MSDETKQPSEPSSPLEYLNELWTLLERVQQPRWHWTKKTRWSDLLGNIREELIALRKIEEILESREEYLCDHQINLNNAHDAQPPAPPTDPIPPPSPDPLACSKVDENEGGGWLRISSSDHEQTLNACLITKEGRKELDRANERIQNDLFEKAVLPAIRADVPLSMELYDEILKRREGKLFDKESSESDEQTHIRLKFLRRATGELLCELEVHPEELPEEGALLCKLDKYEIRVSRASED